MLYFECDYMEGAHPEVLRRLVETNMEKTLGYGTDAYCEEAREKIRAACGAPEADVYFLAGGTQTNALVAYSFLKPCQGMISPVTGHVNHHESGAVEATGHKVIALPASEGKLSVAAVREYIESYWADENYQHIVEPGMVYLTHPTELGTLYTLPELTEFSELCRKYRIPLYVDGARLGYALASDANDISLLDLARLCDAFYIGGTKCGAMFGEALVVTNRNFVGNLFSIIKQRGAMTAKGRLLGVQFSTLFTDGLYAGICRNAIETASMLVDILRSKGYGFLAYPVTNQLFVIMEDSKVDSLRKSVSFSLWERLGDGRSVVRFVTNWATIREDVARLGELL